MGENSVKIQAAGGVGNFAPISMGGLGHKAGISGPSSDRHLKVPISIRTSKEDLPKAPFQIQLRQSDNKAKRSPRMRL